MRVSFTLYARLRMAGRGVTPKYVLDALATLDEATPPTAPESPPGAWAVRRLEAGSLTIVYRRWSDRIVVLNVIRRPDAPASR